MKEKDILDEVLDSLLKNHRAIGKRLAFYEDKEGTEFATFLNTQTKIARSIYECISLMRDPKKQILPGRRGKEELAKMMESVKGLFDDRKDDESYFGKEPLMMRKDSYGHVIPPPVGRTSLSIKKFGTPKRRAR